jgi:hypothetical protein
MELICPDQTTFLPLRFILDSIFLTHETIFYAKKSNQPLAFLKMDFSKAYDRIDLRFMFTTLDRLGCPQKFIDMIKLLFLQAEAYVSINKRRTTRRMACSYGLVECVLTVKCAFDKKLCSFKTCF